MAGFPWHVCSAHCRDGRHAEVVYGDPATRRAVERYAPEDFAAILSRGFGVRVVHVEPAPEARPFPEVLRERRGLAARIPDVTVATRHAATHPEDYAEAWLVVYEEVA